MQKLNQLSRQLGISRNEFATICFEYVDAQHPGIQRAAQLIKDKKLKNNTKKVDKKDLSKHLNKLSPDQVALLLSKAKQKNKI